MTPGERTFWADERDRFWRMAMQMAYQQQHREECPLNAVEQAALLPVCVQYAHRGPDDLLWAAVPVLQADGSARMAPLTIARVEQHARDYAAKRYSISASMEPSE